LEPDVSDTATEQVTEQVDQTAPAPDAPDAPAATSTAILPRAEWTDEYLRSFDKVPDLTALSGALRADFLRARSKAIYGEMAAAQRAERAAKREARAVEIERATAEPVIFTSATREPFPFDIMNLRPERDPATWHLLWRVPAELADTFEQHHHVQMGRVRRS
jgi:hypothetical protein